MSTLPPENSRKIISTISMSSMREGPPIILIFCPSGFVPVGGGQFSENLVRQAAALMLKITCFAGSEVL
jgi:hypothetical protein